MGLIGRTGGSGLPLCFPRSQAGEIPSDSIEQPGQWSWAEARPSVRLVLVAPAGETVFLNRLDLLIGEHHPSRVPDTRGEGRARPLIHTCRHT